MLMNIIGVFLGLPNLLFLSLVTWSGAYLASSYMWESLQLGDARESNPEPLHRCLMCYYLS